MTASVELAERKKHLLEELRRLTCDQARLLEPEKAEELQAVLEKKQDLMEEVTGVDAGAARLEREIQNTLEKDPGAGAGAVTAQKQETVASLRRSHLTVLREIKELDDRNREKAHAAYRRLKDTVKSLRAGRRSQKAYRRPAPHFGGCFVDKKK